jgi:hypothetical protein
MNRYQRFDELLVAAKQLHDKKGRDYEGNGRPYENLREGEDWGVEPWKMAMMRAGEKLRRVKSFAKGQNLENESAFDSLMDIAILSLIAYALLEEEVTVRPCG